MNADDILQRIRSRLPLNRCSCDVAGAVRVNRVDLPEEPVVRAQPIARDLGREGAEREISLGDPSIQLRSEVLPAAPLQGSMLPWLLGGAAVLGATLLLLPRG